MVHQQGLQNTFSQPALSFRDDKDELLHHLIGTIYSTAIDPRHWPELMEQIAQLLILYERDGDQLPHSAKNGKERFDKSMGRFLESHLEHAISLGSQTDDITKLGESSLAILNLLPIAIFLVDKNYRVCKTNTGGRELLSRENVLRIKQERLETLHAKKTLSLHKMIDCALKDFDPENTSSEAIMVLEADDTGSTVTLAVTAGKALGVSQGLVAILIMVPETLTKPSVTALRFLYSLTRAEADLASALVEGVSLNDYATRCFISKHTVRNQLKSIFSKTGVNRQAQLVRLILTGPAMMDIGEAGEQIKKRRAFVQLSQVVRERIIRLPDGRQMALGCYGYLDEKPFFLIHGIDGSRLQMPFDPRELKKRGIHCVIPERPGFGISTPQQGRTLLDFAGDMEQVMDYFGWEQYRLLAYQSGGAYAMACAYCLGQRIDNMVLVSSVGPPETLVMYEKCNLFWRTTLGVAVKFPMFFGPFVKLLSKGVLQNFNAYWARSTGQGSQSERNIQKLLSHMNGERTSMMRRDLTLKDFLELSFREASRQGIHHISHEACLITRDWNFDISLINTPTHLWYGCDNTVLPIDIGRYLANKLPNTVNHFIEGEGNYFFFKYLSEIVAVETASR